MAKKILCTIMILFALTFAFTSCSGAKGIENAAINDKGELILTYTDGTVQNLGNVKGGQGIQGEKGNDGLTPTVEISSDGYWVINGEKTNVKAKGEDGKDAASDDENPQGLAFYLKDDGTYAVAVGNAKYLSKIEIPSMYRGKEVTEIARHAFGGPDEKFSSIVEIIIPNTIKIICESGFGSCDALANVYYTGNEEEWNAIQIDEYHNNDLKNATIHYNYNTEK